MASSMKVKKGDSTDIFEITIDGVTDYTDYRGEVSVLFPKSNAAAIVKYSILPANGKITLALSPSQTGGLAVGDYNVVFEVIKETNGVVEFRRELSWPLQIQPSLLNN